MRSPGAVALFFELHNTKNLSRKMIQLNDTFKFLSNAIIQKQKKACLNSIFSSFLLSSVKLSEVQ